jgi:ribbon-helix-helix CopG family protein
MRRTTVYLETETDLLLKREAMRRKKPVAELIREALDGYVNRSRTRLPPGIGAFNSGFRDTAERAEEILKETGFGDEVPRDRGTRSARRKRRPAKG